MADTALCQMGNQPPTKMCTAPNFRPMSVVAKRLECIKMPLCKAVGLDPDDSVRWGPRPSSPQGKGHSSPPLFCPCLLLPNCRPSQQLLSCYGHSAQQMWTLYFAAVISIFLSIFLSSSPNFSGRRLDVYHTFTHDLALVRIQNEMCCLVACGSLKIQDAKVRHL